MLIRFPRASVELSAPRWIFSSTYPKWPKAHLAQPFPASSYGVRFKSILADEEQGVNRDQPHQAFREQHNISAEDPQRSPEAQDIGRSSWDIAGWTRLERVHSRRGTPRPPLSGQPFSYPDERPWPPASFEARIPWTKDMEVALLDEIKHGEVAELSQHQMTRPLLLTLDAFDTLFTPRPPVPQQYCEVAAAAGIQLKPSDVEASFKKAFKALNSTHPNYGKDQGLHYNKWWTILIHDTLRDLVPKSSLGKLKSISRQLVKRFSSKLGYELFDDVLPFLSMVGSTWKSDVWAPSRTMLGIISNSDPRVAEILESFNIPIESNLFPPRYVPSRGYGSRKFGAANPAFATYSYDCGYSKPDPMIFDAAVRDAQRTLDKLQVYFQLSKTGLRWLNNIRKDFHHMHVGDELEKDVLPALECGWDAIWLNREANEQVSIQEIKGHKITVINNLLALTKVVSKERFELEDGFPAQSPVWMDETTEIERISPSSLQVYKGAEPGRGSFLRRLYKRGSPRVYKTGAAAWRRIKDRVTGPRRFKDWASTREEQLLKRTFAGVFKVHKRNPNYNLQWLAYDRRLGLWRRRRWRYVPFGGDDVYAAGWLARASSQRVWRHLPFTGNDKLVTSWGSLKSLAWKHRRTLR